MSTYRTPRGRLVVFVESEMGDGWMRNVRVPENVNIMRFYQKKVFGDITNNISKTRQN